MCFYTFWRLLHRMEAKTKSSTFLAESCGRAATPLSPSPTAPTNQKYPYFIWQNMSFWCYSWDEIIHNVFISININHNSDDNYYYQYHYNIYLNHYHYFDDNLIKGLVGGLMSYPEALNLHSGKFCIFWNDSNTFLIFRLIIPRFLNS